MTTDEIDRVVHEFLVDHDAYPSTLGYKGFPKSCCTSLNEVICHGIPDSTVIQDGDIVNIDVTAFIGGVHGDTNATFLAGDVDGGGPAAGRAHPRGHRCGRSRRSGRGRELNVVGRVIESLREAVRLRGGARLHRSRHRPQLPLRPGGAALRRPGGALLLEPGMTFTIEPMITIGSSENEKWDDDWTVVTADGSRTAQFEHTVLVTEDGSEILTLPSAIPSP